MDLTFQSLAISRQSLKPLWASCRDASIECILEVAVQGVLPRSEALEIGVLTGALACGVLVRIDEGSLAK